MGLDNGKFYDHEMSENSASRTFSIFFYVENNIIHVKKNRKSVSRIIFWHLGVVKFSVIEDHHSVTVFSRNTCFSSLALQFY